MNIPVRLPVSIVNLEVPRRVDSREQPVVNHCWDGPAVVRWGWVVAKGYPLRYYLVETECCACQPHVADCLCRPAGWRIRTEMLMGPARCIERHRGSNPIHLLELALVHLAFPVTSITIHRRPEVPFLIQQTFRSAAPIASSVPSLKSPLQNTRVKPFPIYTPRDSRRTARNTEHRSISVLPPRLTPTSLQVAATRNPHTIVESQTQLLISQT